jgi:hypothetical protein
VIPPPHRTRPNAWPVVLRAGCALLLLASGCGRKESGSTPESSSAPGAAAVPAPTNRPVRINFLLLGRTTFEEGGNLGIPEPVMAAEDKRVRINGYMVPYDSLEDMSTFMLMEKSSGCFFCVPPNLAEVAVVRQAPGGTRKFMDDPIEVTGILRITKPNSPHEAHQAGFVYLLEDARVEKLKWGGKPKFGPGEGDAIQATEHLRPHPVLPAQLKKAE